MTTSLTNIQIPDKSIMDIWGRQAYLGNAFYLPHAGKALGGTSEVIVGVISVPTTTTMGVFLSSRLVYSSTADVINFKFYKGPTVSVNGSATVPVNARTGFAIASIADCFLAPTVTVNGTLITAMSTLAPSAGNLLVVDPGTKLLITAQAVSGTPTAFIQLGWYEI